jgi:hypothetical protein
MADLRKEAEELVVHGLVMLLLADYLRRQPDPDAAVQVMLAAVPRFLTESYGDGLPTELIDEAGRYARQFIEDAHAAQALWPSPGQKSVDPH